jgi:exodeoxyribonuclease III
MGFIGKNKYKKLLNLRPDIAVIQECHHPDSFVNIVDYKDKIWYGDNKNKGLCVLSLSNDYKLTLLVEQIKYDWIVPIQVLGKANFILVVVWTQKKGYSYGKMLYLALKEYVSLFMNQNVIVICDFNVDYNLKGSYSGIGGFHTLTQLFNDLKISSCYHHFYHEDFGQESRATHFHQRKSQLPFHIDYCFVLRSILEDIKEFHIGKSKDWIEVSDHFPLILEIEKII